ncbi:BlaI/MecI/CopY family transcriptional regulator [Micromonospora sp. NBC_01699]|uniref:BlaI/MecI/CopY family transcriptional regulator n=1 Tax=Micromonospora sp. NBC_01699 TaxID=2975984 RepID=UPI002E28F46B|nr:BlaI/MecI/CopY family transcriptional regulator [Micromonospora sp. NBC_01699]
MRGLGDLESAIMDRLWTWRRAATAREIMESLYQERPLAYTTVQKVMDNLFRKGWLSRTQHGRAHLYEATASREIAAANLMREALTDSPDHRAVFAHFLAGMDDEEAKALRAALRQRGRREEQ